MKTIVYYYFLRSIVLLNLTVDCGALFRFRTEAITRVLTEMLDIRLQKKNGGYAHNDVNTLLTQIQRILERQLFEDTSDVIKGLVIDVGNALNSYKSTIHIKKRDVLAASKAAAERARTNNSTVEPDIANNSDAQDKSDWHNVFRLTAIGAKECITEGITKIVGRDITNPILQTMDNSDFKSVDQFQIHQLFTAITEEQRYQSRQTYRDSSSTLWGKFSTGGRHS